MAYKHPKRIHFVGIGGIGMSALAQLFAHEGATVSGSDREASATTVLLESKGIKVKIGQKKENVPSGVEAVVYSDAVPESNPERARAKELGIPQLSYFGMLGKVSAGKRTIAISGTHGKTTTTGMLAKILKDAGAHPTAIIGSIVKDFGSNYLADGANDLFVVEACEYRDHLLELSPHILVITNLEWDHTDWFPSLVALQDTFRKAVARVPADGAIVTDPNNPNIKEVLREARAHIIDYTKEEVPPLKLPGEFNRMNARAALAAARFILPKVENTTIYGSIADFQGTWRRFEYKGKTKNGAEVYDDYAHHPTAIKETLKALRAQTKGKVFVAFHPHLYSRTRDLFEDFAAAFVDTDEVVIAPIYAAREKPDKSISSALLAERIRGNGQNASASTFEEIERLFGNEPKEGDAVMTMGAGDIYKIADNLVLKQ